MAAADAHRQAFVVDLAVRGVLTDHPPRPQGHRGIADVARAAGHVEVWPPGLDHHVAVHEELLDSG